MASSLEFVEYVCEQIRNAGEISYKKMFGEFGIYCDGKLIGSICDNQFFVKKTEEGQALLEDFVEAPPYPGAKPQFLMESLEDHQLLSMLIKQTHDALPMPKPKKKK